MTTNKIELRHKWNVQSVVDDNIITYEEIAELRNWLSEQSELPHLTDEQLVCLHLSCDKEFNFTKKTIKEFVKVKKNYPKLFSNRTLDRSDFLAQLNTVQFSIFPKRTDDGCAILFHRLHDYSYSKYFMEPSMTLLFMTLDRAIYEYPPKGLIVLFDMKGVGLLHLTKVKLGLVKPFFQYLQDGLPIKLKEIHVMNIVYFIDKCLNIAKPFMNPRIYDMLHLHPTNVNMEEFYEKYIPKSCLPEDYGGDLPNTTLLHDVNTQVLKEMEDYFSAEETIRCEKQTEN